MIPDILTILLAVILVVLLLLLCVPFHYSATLENSETSLYYGAKVSWLFGLVRVVYDNKYLFHIRLLGIPIRIKGKKEKEEKKEEKKKEKKKKKRKVTGSGIACLIKCIKKIVRKYKPKKLTIKGQLGFEDPGITGFVRGIVSFFTMPIDIEQLEFRYDEDVFNVTIHTTGIITLYYLVYIFMRLMAYKPTRLLLK
jgi:hypothetical protein